ncbi:hypothetical protein BC826DRAFT_965177 [Russula brevipes]|nr:hypothetical protein BC826DRAFT_965177 [Russula brevipes]
MSTKSSAAYDENASSHRHSLKRQASPQKGPSSQLKDRRIAMIGDWNALQNGGPSATTRRWDDVLSRHMVHSYMAFLRMAPFWLTFGSTQICSLALWLSSSSTSWEQESGDPDHNDHDHDRFGFGFWKDPDPLVQYLGCIFFHWDIMASLFAQDSRAASPPERQKNPRCNPPKLWDFSFLHMGLDYGRAARYPLSFWDQGRSCTTKLQSHTFVLGIAVTRDFEKCTITLLQMALIDKIVNESRPGETHAVMVAGRQL